MKHQKNQKKHTGGARQRTAKFIFLTCLLAAMMAASGCTTFKPVTGPANPQLTNELMVRSIKAGDTVKIVTKDGRDLKFKVEQIAPETISGENQSVSFQEIAKLEKRKISAGKSTALGLGVVGIAIIGVGVAAAIAFAAVISGG